MNEICMSGEKEPSFTFLSNNDWLIKISIKDGIKFNREMFPNSMPEDFAQAFIDILEKNYDLKFYNKND